VTVEFSYPFTLRDAGDEAPNLLGEDSLHRGYPATLRGQQRFMNDVVQMTLRAALGHGFALGERHAVRFPQWKRAHAGGGLPQGDPRPPNH
jgi:arabinogalactan endo-1,4-beta-galactosidase